MTVCSFRQIAVPHVQKATPNHRREPQSGPGRLLHQQNQLSIALLIDLNEWKASAEVESVLGRLGNRLHLATLKAYIGFILRIRFVELQVNVSRCCDV
jgi:hypothetical protein